MQAVGNLDALFRVAVLQDERSPKKPQDVGVLNDIQHYRVPMPFDGEVLMVKLMVKRYLDEKIGNRLYLVQAIEIENAGVVGEDPSVSGQFQSGIAADSSPPSGVSYKLRQMIDAVNGNGVSKVIDPQTGEPLVVYHGTTRDFGEDGKPVAFRDDRATMISPSPKTASTFAFNSGNVMSRFANIKNPHYTEDQNDAENIPYWMTGEELRNGDYDGLIYSKKGNILKGASGWGDDIPQYAVFSPEQLKSATGNNGNFDPDNKDIRHSFAGQSAATAPLTEAEATTEVIKKFGNAGKVLMDAGQIVMVRTEEGLANYAGGRYSKKSNPIFYSQLSKQIESAPDRMFSTAPQLKLWIAGNKSKLGIKDDEIQWSGINEYLDTLGKSKVSKQQVLDYLDQGGVHIQEVMKGKEFVNPLSEKEQERWEVLMNEFAEWDGNGYSGARKLTEAEKAEKESYETRHNEALSNFSRTKYSNYVIPSGENYRELLLTLPDMVEARKKPIRDQSDQST